MPAGSGQPTTGSIEIQKSGVHRRPAPAATNANPNPPLPGANPMTKNSLIGFRAGGGGIPSPQGQVRLPLNPHTQHTERTYRPNPGRFPHCRSSQSMSYSVCPGNASTRTPAATAAVSTATSRWAPGRPPKAWGGDHTTCANHSAKTSQTTSISENQSSHYSGRGGRSLSDAKET